MQRSRRLTAAFALSVLLLPGCVGGSAPPDRFYRLEAPAPKTTFASPVFPGSLRVAPLRGDALSRGTALLYRDPSEPQEVRRHGYHHWTDSPSSMLQSELIRFLRSAGVAEVVLAPDVSVKPDYVLAGRILRLERILGGSDPARVVLELELNVTRAAGRSLVFHRTYREEQPSGGDVTAAAGAMNEAFDRILQRFLSDVAAPSDAV